MARLKDLLELARRIKDPDLRKRTEDILKKPSLTHKKLGAKYPGSNIRECPASISFHHTQTGGLLEHTHSVTLMCVSLSEALEKAYGQKLDTDSLIAGALLHDIGKLWALRKKNSRWEANDNTIEHVVLGSAELYSRGFPEKVIHMVSTSHSEPDGLIPPLTLEALILHTADNLDATIGKSREEGIIRLLLG
jgi:putative nucleotidyltransferase with HDIG domain